MAKPKKWWTQRISIIFGVGGARPVSLQGPLEPGVVRLSHISVFYSPSMLWIFFFFTTLLITESAKSFITNSQREAIRAQRLRKSWILTINFNLKRLSWELFPFLVRRLPHDEFLARCSWHFSKIGIFAGISFRALSNEIFFVIIWLRAERYQAWELKKPMTLG